MPLQNEHYIYSQNSPAGMLFNKLKKVFSEKQREIIRYWVKSIPAFLYEEDLSALAKLYGTDKYEHGYTAIYQNYFKKLSAQNIHLLEIGIGGGDNTKFGGNSLKMWAKFFPKAKIHGIDIYDKSLIDYRRIKTYRGDQSDAIFLEQFSNLDIIIDDGGHINQDMIRSFNLLFPKLNKGGYYCIEDIENSYWNESGGDEVDLNNESTVMNYFKSLTDSLNYKVMRRKEIIDTLRKDIEYIHFYSNLIIIKKNSSNG